MPAIAAPRGTHDLLPEEETAWTWLHRTHREVAASYGYRLVDPPIFEATDLFARGVGAGTDLVEKEMYVFTDRGGRSLTLRPEGTAGVVRAVLAARLEQHVRPVRVRYGGPMFRYDRPQQGRRRQFSTVGVECIGERSPHLDAEVIEVASRFFSALGLAGLSLQVNTLGGLDDRRRYRAALLDFFTPRLDELCEDCRRRLEINPLRLLDCKRDAEVVATAPTIDASLDRESAAYFDAVLEDLSAAGIPWERNLRLVRGLDYYSDTAFEFWHTSLQGAQNALGGGGRYDGLAEVIGFPPTPGVGYGLGVDRILQVAARLGVVPAPRPECDAVVVSIDRGQTAAAAAIARSLRERGVRAVLDTSERKLDRKLRDADRRAATVAVLVGAEEKPGEVVVRDLTRREQRATAVEEVPVAVVAVLRAARRV